MEKKLNECPMGCGAEIDRVGDVICRQCWADGLAANQSLESLPRLLSECPMGCGGKIDLSEIDVICSSCRAASLGIEESLQSAKHELRLQTEVSLLRSDIIRERDQRRQTSTFSNIEISENLLTELLRILVPRCSYCVRLKRARCYHLTAEDNEFAFFWKLRMVCRSWRDTVDSWIRSTPIQLVLYGYEREFTHYSVYFDLDLCANMPGAGRKHEFNIEDGGNKICRCSTATWHNFAKKHNSLFLSFRYETAEHFNK